MKPHAQFVLSGLLTLAAVWLGSLAGVPMLVTLVVMFFVINQSLMAFNARAMLVPRPIPARGYEGRREGLGRDEREILRLGFRKTDEFYLRTISDAVIYVYRHETEPVVLCTYHLGLKTFCDFVTKFEDDITLTTTSGSGVGTTRRPARRLAQVFGNLGYGAMYAAHARASAFIAQHSIRTADVPAAAFREFFVASVKEYNAHAREERFFLMKFVGGMATSAGKRYRMPLERQFPAGLTADLLTG